MTEADYEEISRSERPIFIFASGQRCGSTLLQRFLNSNPNFLIWGEHNGYLRSFSENFRALQDWSYAKSEQREIFFSEGYDNFVPNVVPVNEDLERAAIAHIWTLFGAPARRLGKRIWGFKEVRYRVQIALHLQECFSNARFIHLTRNIGDCFRSMKRWETTGEWEPKWTYEALETWVAVNESFLRRGAHLNHLMTLRYEDMLEMGPQAFARQMGDFLGEPPTSFNLGVFSRKLDGIDHAIPSSRNITDEEKRLIFSDHVVQISKNYGYQTP